MRRHLFLAMSRAAMGEMTLGLRLAGELVRSGDEVLFLAPALHAPLFAGTPFKHGAIDAVQDVIHDALPGVIAKRRIDDVVLIDLTSNFIAFALLGVDPRFLARLPVPVAALDIWNVAETDLRLDTGPDALQLDASARDLQRLLIPVPFVRPDAHPGVYNAWPEVAAPPPGARAALGLDEDARLILLTTARWQLRTAHESAYLDRLMPVVPELLLGALALLPEAVRVLHVGPEPFAAAPLLGARYRHERALPPAAFAATLGASDLVLNLNQSATSTLSALAMGIPALSVMNSYGGATAAEVAASLPAAPTPRVAAALERLAPLWPFRMWPLGAYRYLGAALRDNPYPVPSAELLDEEALVERCRVLLFDAAARAELADRTQAYGRVVRGLPSAAARLRAVL